MKSLKSRRLTDKVARWVITFGGATTVFVMLALFLFIFFEVYPLFKSAQVLKTDTFSLHGDAVAIGVDEHQAVVYAVYQEGVVEFISLSDGSVLKRYVLEGVHGAAITAVDRGSDFLVLGTGDGRMLKVSVSFSVSFADGQRSVSPEISEEEAVQIIDEKKALKFIAFRGDESTSVVVVCTEDDRLALKSSESARTLFGPEERKEIRRDITGLVGFTQSDLPLSSGPSLTDTAGREGGITITSLALDLFMENLYVGTSSGDIFHINVQDRENPFLVERIRAAGQAITAVCFLLGDVSLIAGDDSGGVNVWMQVRNEVSPSGWSFKKVHTLPSHSAPVLAAVSSRRDKGFVTAASDGTVYLSHSTSEQTRLLFDTESVPTALTFSPKANGILAATSDRKLFHWTISNAHPEITLKTLFGRVWYEGYEKPEFVWQSTGGTDDFEPKLSLVPLIFGTIKGTVYALIIAVPIGVLAALYTSQFLHKTLKIVKPVVETMAALPSVILGFLAGLWLAPLMERILPAIIFMPVSIIISIAIAFSLWKFLPSRIKGRYRFGAEALFLIPFFIGGVYASIHFKDVIEQCFFHGDYSQWLLNVLGLKYDQRNAVVVGFAMGFAVIPLVFTISEDAMSNVPNSLISASLALGATPWQTAVRVVLPTASPGIFSAVMIGFGRAVGETMIVLMATGNTPVMDWNLFNGFRALAANIAVEIPEAPFGGTLYRVLFLAALLLFVTTFIVNTFAEMVRQKMRRRYSKL